VFYTPLTPVTKKWKTSFLFQRSFFASNIQAQKVSSTNVDNSQAVVVNMCQTYFLAKCKKKRKC